MKLEQRAAALGVCSMKAAAFYVDSPEGSTERDETARHRTRLWGWSNNDECLSLPFLDQSLPKLGGHVRESL